METLGFTQLNYMLVYGFYVIERLNLSFGLGISTGKAMETHLSCFNISGFQWKLCIVCNRMKHFVVSIAALYRIESHELYNDILYYAEYIKVL